MQTTLNTLVGQNLQGSGFSSLNQPTVDPTNAALLSKGSRTSSITTGFTYTTTTTTIHMFWDGTNNSKVLRVYRDDSTVAGPFVGDQLVTGLTAATTYYFYPYFDEAQQIVKFVSQSGAVGTPPIAYLTPTIEVGQTQILRGHIPLAGNLAITGIATPAAGSTTPVSSGGGGGSGGSYLGRSLL